MRRRGATAAAALVCLAPGVAAEGAGIPQTIQSLDMDSEIVVLASGGDLDSNTNGGFFLGGVEFDPTADGGGVCVLMHDREPGAPPPQFAGTQIRLVRIERSGQNGFAARFKDDGGFLSSVLSTAGNDLTFLPTDLGGDVLGGGFYTVVQGQIVGLRPNSNSPLTYAQGQVAFFTSGLTFEPDGNTSLARVTTRFGMVGFESGHFLIPQGQVLQVPPAENISDQLPNQFADDHVVLSDGRVIVHVDATTQRLYDLDELNAQNPFADLSPFVEGSPLGARLARDPATDELFAAYGIGGTQIFRVAVSPDGGTPQPFFVGFPGATTNSTGYGIRDLDVGPSIKLSPQFARSLYVSHLDENGVGTVFEIGLPDDPACVPWHNGEPDYGAAQAVQRIDTGAHGEPFESLVADDFLFKKNDFFCIDSIDVWLAVNASAPAPDPATLKLDFYVDCNGRPGELANTLTSQVVHANDIFADVEISALGPTPFAPDFDVYRVRFVVDEFSEHFAPLRDNLYSEPFGYQRFWLAPYVHTATGGIGNYFWITSNFIDPAAPDDTKVVQGVQAQYRSGAFGFADWIDGDDASCCFPGCADFAFRINGECCELIFETTPPKFSGVAPPYDDMADPLGIRSSLQQNGPRAADDFQVCKSEFERYICRIEAWLATNCDEDQLDEVVLELYANECDEPVKVLADPMDPTSDLVPIAVLRDPEWTFIESLGGLNVYKFVFEKPKNVTLEGGRNYWLSLVGPDTASLLIESLFMFSNEDRADPDDAACVDQLEPAHVKNQFLGLFDFEPIDDPEVAPLVGLAMPEHRDLAFRVFLVRDGASLHNWTRAESDGGYVLPPGEIGEIILTGESSVATGGQETAASGHTFVNTRDEGPIITIYPALR